MHWQQLIITTTQYQANDIADLLTEHNALAISFVDAADQPLFQVEVNETPLWETVKLSALFPQETNLTEIITNLEATLNKPLKHQIEELAEQDWVRETQRQFSPELFANRLWICPSWAAVADNLQGTVVKIDPGLAFGTGTHPTTALCLEWLAENPPIDKVVIDYGCGSGILALAALALGATKVYAIDHDEQALQATHNNAALNDFVTPENLMIGTAADLPVLSVPLIIANILANPLIALAGQLKHLLMPNGTLILSGILNEEIERVAQAYCPPLSIQDTAQQDEWARVTLQ